MRILIIVLTHLILVNSLMSYGDKDNKIMFYNYEQPTFFFSLDYSQINNLPAESLRKLVLEESPGTTSDCISEVFEKVEIELNFRRGEQEYGRGLNNYDASVIVELKAMEVGMPSNNEIYLCTLNIETVAGEINVPESVCITDVTEFVQGDPNAANFIFTIENITATGIQQYDVLEARLLVNRSVELISSPSDWISIIEPSADDFSVPQTPPTSIYPQVTFKWKLDDQHSCEDDEVPFYQIQLLRLFNNSLDDVSDPRNITTEIDWNKALNFEVSGTNYDQQTSNLIYTISITEGTGYYIWRIRPIVDHYKNFTNRYNTISGGIADDRNWGEWLNPFQNTTEIKQGDIISISTHSNLFGGFYFEQFDHEINWKYERIFTEGEKDSKILEKITYADNLLNVRQNQKYIVSDESKIVSQTIYDYAGRPAINTLPVPFDKNAVGNLGYQKGLVNNGAAELYSAKDFDDGRFDSGNIPENIYDPNSVGSSDLLDYYDGNASNTTPVLNEDRVPSSTFNSDQSTNNKAIPYKRNLYENNSFSEVKETTGFGEPFSLGSQSTGESRTTKIERVTALPSEIMSVLGNETPRMGGIKKTIKQDPNGVITIEYHNSLGKLIATAVKNSETPSLNLEELDYDNTKIDKETLNDEQIQYVFDNKILTEEGYTESIRIHLTSIPTALSLIHDFQQNSIQVDCYYIANPESNCISCYDSVLIDILDAKTLKRPLGFTTIKITDNQSISGSCPTDPPIDNYSVSLPPGTYIITKTVYTKQDEYGFSPKEDVVNRVESNIKASYKSTFSAILDLLEEVINGDKEMNDVYNTLDANVIEWGKTTDTELNLDYYYYKPFSESIDDCCEIKIYKYDCASCQGDLLTEDNGDYTSKFQRKLIEEINSFLSDNGIADSDLPRHPLDNFENLSDPNDPLNEVIDNVNVYPYFFRNDYQNESGIGNDNLYSTTTDGLFDEMIENMKEDGTRNFQDEELCDCWSNSINLLKYNGIKFIETSPGFEFDESFDLLDVFLECVDKKYDENDTDKDICYEGYTNHPYEENPPVADGAPEEGYLSHAYKYFYYDPNDEPSSPALVTCWENLNIAIKRDVNDNEWEVWDRTLTNYYVNDADANNSCEPLDVDNLENERYHLIYTKLYGCLRNEITEQEADDAWAEGLGEFCGESSYSDLTDAITNIDDIVNCLNDACENKCESKFDEFVPRLIKLFNENKYSVQGQSYYQDFNTNPNDPDYVDPNGSDFWDIVEQYRMKSGSNKGHEIDMEEIYCMATALVENCKTYCDVDKTTTTPQTLDISEDFKKVFQSDFELEFQTGNPLSCSSGFALVDPITTSSDIAPRWGQYIENVMNRLLDELILFNPNIPADWDEYRYYDDQVSPGIFQYSGGNTKAYHYRNGCPGNMDYKFTFWKDAYTPMEYNNSGSYLENDDLNDYNANLIHTMLNLLSVNMCISEVKDNWLCQVQHLSGFQSIETESDFDAIWESYYLFEGVLSEYPGQNKKIEKVYFEWVDNSEFNLVFEHNIPGLNTIRYKLFDFNNNGTFPSLCTHQVTFSCDSSVCFKWKDSYEVPANAENIAEKNIKQSCDFLTASKLKFELESQIGTCAANIADNAGEEYTKTCQTPEKDLLTVSYGGPDYYHYTLYYYDRAGNLIKTVPPNGIDFDENATRNTAMEHTFESTYEYDSRNFLVEEKIPDRTHESVFIYNTIDQLTFSYDARQYEMEEKSNTNYYYSYSIYDEQGRIIETGEAEADPTHMATIGANFGFGATDIESYLKFNASHPLTLENFIENNLDRKMFIKTVYGFKIDPLLHHNQDPNFPYQGNNLRNRINYTIRDEDGDNLTKGDQVKTYYSYDLHGNVEWLMNDIAVPEFDIPLPFRFIGMTRYDYDLISGNVKKVYYNPGRNDSYFHKYEYDEDQRIKLVESSRYGRIWDKDSKYEYYKHGPLKRIEIGDDNLQGIDYTYTINGWLKGINHNTITDNTTTTLDPNQDGISASTFEKDAFGMILSYFDDDYWNSSLTHFNQNIDETYDTGNELFNGNIRNWSFAEFKYSDLVLNNKPQFPENTKAFSYKYDVLNRILNSDEEIYDGINAWNPPLNDEYKSDYEYDPNGNILKLNRNAQYVSPSSNMDELDYEYSYEMGPNYEETNRLINVYDQAGLARTTDYPGMTMDPITFDYDGSGNLIKDATSFINNIEWTSDGKIKKINFAANPYHNNAWIEFRYDALGNRVSKKIRPTPTAGPDDKYTFYMREANSNVLAVYDAEGTEELKSYNPCFTLEFHCPLVEGITYRQVCLDDYYIDVNSQKIYHITSTVNPILDCDGNPIQFSEIIFNTGTNTAEIVFDPVPPPPNSPSMVLIYSSFSLNPESETALKLAEWHIWGNGSEGRVGIRRPERTPIHYFDDYINYPFPTNNFSRYIRYKDYELKDHLGNVRATITDLKLLDGLNYKFDLSSANTYYPFGMLMPERNWSSEWYRYGFQGQEKDDEIKGEGNSLDFGARIYNSRLGKWLTIDPMNSMYPSNSPYNFTLNNPILIIDFNGEYDVMTHYDLTFKSLKKLGYTSLKTDILSHYASVFADNPNILIQILQQSPKRFGYNYDLTKGSQDTKSVLKSTWHSMLADGEMSSQAFAKLRGQEFGWGRIIEAGIEAEKVGGLEYLEKNSIGIEAFGQGTHALQDAEAHEGSNMKDHDMKNDLHPSVAELKRANEITTSAIIVTEIISGDYKNLTNGLNLNLTGTNKEQFNQIMNAVDKALSTKPEGFGITITRDNEN